MKRQNRRFISEGRGSDGEMEMVRGLSWVTQTEARKTVSLSSQGSHPSGQEENGSSSNVWVTSKKLCRALSCSLLFIPLLLCGKMARSAPALSPWAPRLSHHQHCPPGDQPGEVVCHLRLSMLKTPKQGRLHCRRIACPSVFSDMHGLQFPNGLESVCDDADSVSWCWF